MVAKPDTDERNRSWEERVSRIEGGYEHLATKADIERVLFEIQRSRTEFLTEIERSRAESLMENERNRTELERVRAELERNRAESQIENERNRTELERNRAELERVRAESRIDNERNRAELERVRAEVERNRADIVKIIIQIAGVGAALIAAGFAFLRLTGTG